MRWLVLLLLFGSGFVFFLQNKQPITLFFLGNNAKVALLTLTFPLGLWVILFIVAGIITALILQSFNAIARPIFPPAPSRPRSRPTPTPRSPEPPRSPNPETKTRIQTPTNPQWEWENPIPEVDDWEDDEPQPVETRSPEPVEQPVDIPRRPEPVDIPRRVTIDLFSQAPPENYTVNPLPRDAVKPSESQPRLRDEDLKRFEVAQEPKTTSQEGTIYSQTYREPRTAAEIPRDRTPEKPLSKHSNPNQVYDANYRVINPPLRPVEPSNVEEDDEDWL
jgi:hypothetical protein